MGLLFEHIDAQFQKDLTSRCKLAIEIGLDRGLIAVTDTFQNQVSYLAAFSIGGTPTVLRALSELDKLCAERPWLTRAFNSTTALIRGSRYTLVPAMLFKEELTSSYLGILGLQNPSTICFSYELPDQKARVIFDLSSSLRDALDRNWPGIELRNFDAQVAVHCSSGLPEGDFVSAFLNVDGLNTFQLALFRGKELLFLNTFSFKTVDDFIYFLHAVLESKGLDAHSINLKLSGDIDKGGALFDALFRYVRNISFMGRSMDLSYSEFFGNIPSHRFVTLFSTF
jgi:hypothetical protein